MSAPVTEERIWTREELKALKRRDLQKAAQVCLFPLFVIFPQAPRTVFAAVYHIGYLG